MTESDMGGSLKHGSQPRAGGQGEPTAATRRPCEAAGVENLSRDFDLAQALAQPVLVVDPNFRIVFANKAARSSFSQEEGDLCGRICYEVFHGLDAPARGCPLKKLLESGRAEVSEMDVEVLGRIFVVSCTPVFGENGILREIIHVATDVTDLRTAEADSKARRLEIEFIAKSGTELLGMSSEEEIFRYVSAGIRQLAGGQPVVVLFTIDETLRRFKPRVILGIGRSLDRLMEILGRDPMNMRGSFPDSLKSLMAIGRLVRIEGGIRALLAGNVNDQSSSAVMELLDLKDAYAIGFTGHGGLQGGLLIITREPSAYFERSYAIEALATQAAACLARTAAQARKDAMEARLLHSQKMEAVGRLARGIAHDFNNLMTVVTGYSSMILETMPDAHPDKGLLSDILKAGQKASLLTRQLLAFSRKQPMLPKRIEPSEEIGRLSEMIERLLGETIRFELAPDPSRGAIMADPSRFEQVIVNLALNAKDAMPGGGVLSFAVSSVEPGSSEACDSPEMRESPQVMIKVADTGHGIEKQLAVRIFEPFFTTRDKSNHSGLGLATVWGIVEQSRGCIAVKSEPGKGSAFTMLFPRLPAVEKRSTSKPQRSKPSGSERVLVVEDDPGVRAVVVAMLAGMGFAAQEAENAAQALEIIEHGPCPDVLLTDVIMPGMSGTGLALAACESRPGLRVILMSGYSGEEIGKYGVEEHAFEFIQKPFSASEIGRKIREVLR